MTEILVFFSGVLVGMAIMSFDRWARPWLAHQWATRLRAHDWR
jgi:hypothetical protein